MTRRWLRRGLALLVLVLVVLLLRATLFRPDRVPVTVVPAARGPVEETVAGSRAGTVKSRRRATLSPEVGGRVERLAVRKGDRVKKGDVLVRIAAEDVRAQLVLAEKSLVVAEAAEREACRAAEQARRDLARSEQLAKDEVLSVGLLEKAQTEAGMTAAACEAARARVGQARASLDVARVARREDRPEGAVRRGRGRAFDGGGGVGHAFAAGPPDPARSSSSSTRRTTTSARRSTRWTSAG